MVGWWLAGWLWLAVVGCGFFLLGFGGMVYSPRPTHFSLINRVVLIGFLAAYFLCFADYVALYFYVRIGW